MNHLMKEKIFTINSGDLIEIQRTSYYKFLFEDIQKELENFPNPFYVKEIEYTSNKKKITKKINEYSIQDIIKGSIKNDEEYNQLTEISIDLFPTIPTNIQYQHIYLKPNEVKFSGPSLSFQECIRTETSYNLKVFVNSYCLQPLSTVLFSSIIQLLYTYNEQKSDLKVLINQSTMRSPIDSSKALKKLWEIYQIWKEDEANQNEIKKSNATLNNYINKKKVQKAKLKEFVFSLDLSKPKISSKDCYIAEIPLMTQDGTFFINGCERVVVSQIIRSPGVYFNKKFETASKETFYTCLLISDQRNWTKFQLPENFVSARELIATINQSRSFSSITKVFEFVELIPYLGISLFEVEENLDYPLFHETFGHLRFPFIKWFHAQKKKKLEESISNLQEDIKDLENQIQEKIVLRKSYIRLNNKLVGVQEKLNEEIRSLENLPNETYNKVITEISTRQKTYYPTAKQILETKKLLKFVRKSGAFSIGEVGRYHLNSKFHLNLAKGITYITGFDLVGILNGLAGLKTGKTPVDDIDHLKNKQIRAIGELIKCQFHIGIQRSYGLPHEYERIGNSNSLRSWGEQKRMKLLEKRNDSYHSVRRDLIKKLYQPIEEFFNTSPLSQYFDQLNPLAELAHKRKVSVFGPNGLKRTPNISTAIRDIHPSQYGKLCAVETPEGENAGLVMALANFVRINPFGSLDTAYYRAKDSFVFSKKTPIYLNTEQESAAKIVFANTFLTKSQQISQKYVSAKEDYIFSLSKSKDIQYFNLSPFQLISVGTSLIPFIEHDDANRALMGSNMQRQALPLLNPQKAIVGTGFEMNIASDSGLVTRSYSEGKILFSSSKEIQILDSNNQILFYSLKKYWRSNQETAITQRPIYWIGEKVFSGQIIADGPGTFEGELAIGKNLTIGYLPWDGYNYEDAIVINENLVIDNVLTSIHIVHYETELPISVGHLVRNAKILELKKYAEKRNEIESEIYEKKFEKNDILKKNEKKRKKIKRKFFLNNSLKKKNFKNCFHFFYSKLSKKKNSFFKKKILKSKNSILFQKLLEKLLRNFTVQSSKYSKTEELFDSKKLFYQKIFKVKKKLYLQFLYEKNNLKQEIEKKTKIETFLKKKANESLEQDSKEKKDPNYEFLVIKSNKDEEITSRRFLPNAYYQTENLDENGVVKLGTYVKSGDLLIGKLKWKNENDKTIPGEKLKDAIQKKSSSLLKDVSSYADTETYGRVIDICIIPRDFQKKDVFLKDFSNKIKISVAHLKKIKVGDKLSGRHGNKGVISKIALSKDMPILPNGNTLDILVNPLGVPSRMNVGQVLECLLGFAGKSLGKRFKITPFDEIYGQEASTILVHEKLKEAVSKTSTNWLFNSNHPGKIFLRDGRTGEFFDNPTTVGCAYILKLVHVVDSKIHARNTGPYQAETQQPLKGRSRNGGQRLGEMEVWALEAHGCSHTLQELLTIKSDDFEARESLEDYLFKGRQTKKPNPNFSETFGLLIHELNSLGFQIGSYKMSGKYSVSDNQRFFNNSKQKTIPLREEKISIFEILESRLKIRGLLQSKLGPSNFTYFQTKNSSLLDLWLKDSEKKAILQKFFPTWTK